MADSRQQEYSSSSRQSSGSGMGFVLVLVGLAFLVGPYFLPIPTAGRLIMNGFGIVLFIIGAVVLTITRLYQKTSADEAFVRTGMGGNKCIIDGGSLIIPVVHQVIMVSLKTTRLDCKREGADALITGDSLRADVYAEFYIKVQKKPEDVIMAATSLGERSGSVDAVNKLVEFKLISALRTVGATMDLKELHTKRNEFAAKVQEIVEKDLAHNGLTLESVTISKLDQTPLTNLHADQNVFDAQGAKKVAEVVQAQRVERETLQADADKKVKAIGVERDQFTFQQDVAQQTAEATKNREIENAKAKARQEALTFKAEQDQKAELAGVAKDQAVQLAGVDRDKAVVIAQTEKAQAAATADIAKSKAIEIATRDRDIALADKETQKASALALQLAAEKDREVAAQAVQTAQVTAQAQREKEKKVIDASAAAETSKVGENMKADVSAYKAIAESKGEMTAAENKAAATIKIATADKEAQVLKAEGEQAIALIPVNVARQQVTVKQAEVDVERASLENREKYGKVAIDLQIALARINAEKDARIAIAQAMGTAIAAADFKIWGDPQTFQRMLGSFTSGQASGEYMDGLTTSMPTGVQSAAEGLVAGVGGVASQVLSRITGGKSPADLLADLSAAASGKPAAPPTPVPPAPPAPPAPEAPSKGSKS